MLGVLPSSLEAPSIVQSKAIKATQGLTKSNNFNRSYGVIEEVPKKAYVIKHLVMKFSHQMRGDPHPILFGLDVMGILQRDKPRQHLL